MTVSKFKHSSGTRLMSIGEKAIAVNPISDETCAWKYFMLCCFIFIHFYCPSNAASPSIQMALLSLQAQKIKQLAYSISVRIRSVENRIENILKEVNR